MSAALREEGYTVHSFSDPAKAIEDIAKCGKNVGMLITDIRMPEYSGFDVARKAREANPVVLMTAFEMNTPEFEKMFPSLKIEAFLQKPFNTARLLAVVTKYLL